MPKIICLGIAVLDQIFRVENLPSKAGKYFADSYLEVGGGPGATAAVTIAKLGAEVEFWGRVGDDIIGDRIIEELNSYGVDTKNVKQVKGADSGVSAVLIEDSGERLIVNRSNPNLEPDPSWLPLDHVSTADAVLADSRWIQGAKALLDAAMSAEIISVLDADSTPNEDILPLVQSAKYAAFSKNGLFEVTKMNQLEKALVEVDKMTENWVCVTDGENGTYSLEDGEVLRTPAFDVDVIDTLGAGDVFHGALAYALASGNETKDAILFSNAAAALKCTKVGGRLGIPEKSEVDSLIQKEK